MGLVTARVMFEKEAPSLDEICAAITSICSLPVTVVRSKANRIHTLNAVIAFPCAPHETLELYVYRKGASARFCDDTFKAPGHRWFMKQIVEGANEPAGIRTVHLRGYIGQELTLMETTVLALESLGGTSRHPIADELRREYGRTITEAELLARHDGVRRQSKKMVLGVILMLPILIPLWIIGWIWGILTMPFRICRGLRLLKAIGRQEW